MSASAMFAAELEALGIWWPEGDGDALRIAADGWSAATDLIEDIAAVLDVAAALVVEHHSGEASARFASLWSAWSGPDGYLAGTVADCRRIVAALVDFATDVDVADRALLRLIEDALAAQPLGLSDPAWVAWLADGADAVAGELSARADAASASLATIVAGGPVRSADDRAVLDPARVTWPDLGRPSDLRHLALTPVDLGAGEGDLAVTPVTPLPPIDAGDTDRTVPSPITGPLPTTPGWPSSGTGVTIVIQGDGNTVTVESPAVPTWQPSSADVLSPIEPIAVDPGWGDTVDRPEAAVFDAGAAFAPVTGWDQPIDATATTPAEPRHRLAGLTGADLPEPVLPPPSTPITVAPPGAGRAAAGAVAATTAAAAASGRAPFFPFMPMGGGMTGDESPEPKRRSGRRRPAGA